MTQITAMRVNDPRSFGKVGLLVGGDSAEREVSLNGGKAVLAAHPVTGQGLAALGTNVLIYAMAQ